MIILIHPMSAKMMKRDYPDGIIHESDIILDAMFTNFPRRKINNLVPYEFKTTRKVNPASIKPENLYYFHKHRIFEAVLQVKLRNEAAWPAMQRFMDFYDIDDDIYDISSLYREFTRYIGYRKSFKKAATPELTPEETIIQVNEDQIAQIIADNVDFFYHRSGFDHSKFRQMEAYFSKITSKTLPCRPDRTIRYQEKKFKNYLQSNKKLSNSVLSVLQ